MPGGTSALNGLEIYGNTIYNAKTGASAPKGIQILGATTNVHIRDDLLDVGVGGNPILVNTAGTGLLFQGNDYWANSTTTAGLYWQGTVYPTLTAWRSATGQEKVGTATTGLSVNPLLSNAGGGGTIGDGGTLSKLSAYRLTPSSPLINAGVNLISLGLTPPATDFFGQPVPDGSAFDIGADEVDVVPPTAVASLPAVTAGATTYTFTVTYADNVAINTASMTNGDLKVTGPNGYSQAVKLVSYAGTGTTVTATYSITAPGGTWDRADVGTYTVSVVAGQVTDTTGNWVVARVIGTFASK